MKAAGLGLLLLAVGVTWYLLAKRNPHLLETDAPHRGPPDPLR